MSLLLRRKNAPRHILDAVGVADGSAAVFLDDKRHG
jgi:hypothetical protein